MLQDAKMPSLKDKIVAQAVKVEKVEKTEKKVVKKVGKKK